VKKPILGTQLLDALVEAGVVRADERINRIVIDIRIRPLGAVMMYVERIGDERLLEVATTLEGVEIREVQRTEHPNGEAAS
jgi:hypothetical protein